MCGSLDLYYEIDKILNHFQEVKMEIKVLGNGMNIPAIGFGCYNAKGGDNYQMLRDAITAGYRFFDTASFYETERVLGQAIKDSGIPREEFFIQSKLWIDEMGREGVFAAIERTLSRLQMDYLDVYLIHWPRQLPEVKGAPGYPEVAYSEPEYEACADWKSLQIETYKALEELVEAGKIKGIGLSNFLPHHLMNIMKNCTIKPLVDQLEVHLGYTQATAVEYAKKQGLCVQAWSPLGRSDVLNEPFFKSMADKYGVSVAQLGLRFLYQMDVIPLPKSGDLERQKQNLDIFSFEISEEDYYMIACMVPTCWQKEHPDFIIPKLKSNLEQ